MFMLALHQCQPSIDTIVNDSPQANLSILVSGGNDVVLRVAGDARECVFASVFVVLLQGKAFDNSAKTVRQWTPQRGDHHHDTVRRRNSPECLLLPEEKDHQTQTLD